MLLAASQAELNFALELFGAAVHVSAGTVIGAVVLRKVKPTPPRDPHAGEPPRPDDPPPLPPAVPDGSPEPTWAQAVVVALTLSAINTALSEAFSMLPLAGLLALPAGFFVMFQGARSMLRFTTERAALATLVWWLLTLAVLIAASVLGEAVLTSRGAWKPLGF